MDKKVPDRNNTNFPLYTHELLGAKEWTEESGLLYHQHLVRQYLLGNQHIRGLLVFHGMGTGKTILASRIIKDNLNRKTILIAPRGVQGQFQIELEKIPGPTRMQVIALKSPTLVKQLEDSVADALIPAMEGFSTMSVDDSFIVVDEAHNLFNAIINGSKNAIDLYDMIMHAKNIKLLFLTGSPIVNHPFELVPCFNMLDGRKLFPESLDDFEKYFLRDGHMVNAEKFKNRVIGLISYFGDWIRPPVGSQSPKELPMQVLRIPMSDPQYAIYSTIRDKEREESKRPAKRGVAERFKPKSSSSTYRIRSRQASNMVPIDGITDEMLLKPESSPKFHDAYRIIEERKNDAGMVYDNLVHQCGLADFARLLVLRGWTQWTEDMDEIVAGPRFAIITGDTDPKEREQIRLAFSSRKNARGAIIRVLLVGPAVAEGLDLKNARYGIIISPFFNYTRIEQVKFRIIRHLSLEYLPREEWTVQIYILLADYPKWVKNAKEPTTDVQLYENAKRGKQMHLEFYKAMIEASIDCTRHRDKLDPERQLKVHCKMCAPTGVPLFHDRLDHDIRATDPCKEPQVETVKVQELVVEDARGAKHKFMYQTKDGVHSFYEFSDKLNGYIEIQRNHKYYPLLVEAVEESKPEIKEPDVLRFRMRKPWFAYVQNGVKRVECRRGTSEEAKTLVGSDVEFTDGNAILVGRVKATRHYPNLEEYLGHENLNAIFPGIADRDAAKAEYHKFMSDDAIAKSGGVIAIEFDL